MHKEKTSIEVPWTIWDVVGVSIGLFFSLSVVYGVLSFVVSDLAFRLNAIKYFSAIFCAGIPIAWIRKRYGLSAKYLWFAPPTQSLFSWFGVCVFLAFLFSVVTIIVFAITNGFKPPQDNVQIFWYHILLWPISSKGLLLVILAPFGEGVFFRGFVYGYVRKKFGALLGITILAVAIALWDIVASRTSWYELSSNFVINLLYVYLYENYKNLYPSIVCHSLYNYFYSFFYLIGRTYSM